MAVGRVIVGATKVDTSRIETAHSYGSGGFRTPIGFAHATQRPMPGLLCGTSGGASIAAAKACGRLDALVALFRDLATRNERSALDGVHGFTTPSLGPTLASSAPMAAWSAATLHARDLQVPIALGVTIRRTRQYAVVVMGPDTAEDVFQAVLLGSGAFAPFLPAPRLPAALPGIPAGWSLGDGAHRHTVVVPSREWLPRLQAVELMLLGPVGRPDVGEPEGLAGEIGWSMDCVDLVAIDLDLAYAQRVAAEGVDVDVYAPVVAGSVSDVHATVLKCREVWGLQAAAAPVARWRHSR